MHKSLKTYLVSLLCLPMLAWSANFHVETKYLNTGNDFAKLCGNACPALNYGFISTSQAWINSTINKSVASVFGASGDNVAQDELYKQFTRIAHPTDKQFTEFLTASEKNLINQHQQLIKQYGEGITWIDISSRPTYMGHRGDLELFAINEFYQFGNNKGMGSIYYFVFDIDDQKQLTLDDVLLENGKDKLSQMVQEKFFLALKKGKVDIDKHNKSWTFFLTRNFTFTKDGIKFLYQPEEITPYNMGMPEFVITYDKLKGIVKDEYL